MVTGYISLVYAQQYKYKVNADNTEACIQQESLSQHGNFKLNIPCRDASSPYAFAETFPAPGE